MNWDAIGAVGETLGAVAVLVTLIFLIVQLRQNTKAIEAESARANFEQGTTWMYKIIQDPKLAELYREGLADSLDNQDDRVRFHLLMQALFNQWAMAFIYRSERIVGVSEADVSRVLSTPGGQRYWKRARELDLHAPEFKAYVERILERMRSDA